MKSFIVYKHAKKSLTLDSVIFLQDSFSFPAFFLTFFYTAFNRLWFFSLVLLICFTALEFAYQTDLINTLTYLSGRIIVMFYTGSSYSSWCQEQLKKDGYVIHDVIYARDITKAKLKFCHINDYGT